MTAPQPIDVTGKAWGNATPAQRDELDAAIASTRIRDAQLRDDLVTCIDFCDGVGLAIAAGWDDITILLDGICEAHDIAHVLTGGDRTMDWTTVLFLVADGDDQDNPAFGPAWPDVRRRMAEVIARAEGMAE